MITVLELGGRNARVYLPGNITRSLRHTNCLLVHKSQEQHSGGQQAFSAARWPFFFLPRDLALIHSHSSDVLTPKGPCPVVTEQLAPPPLIFLMALLVQQKSRQTTAAELLSHGRTTFSAQVKQY